MAAPISALLATWFTPSSLFIVVNIVIGTIAVTSRFANSPKKQTHNHDSPSLLQRVRSFTLTHNTYDPTPPLSLAQPPQLLRTPSLLDRVRSFNFGLHTYETQHQDQAQQPQPEGPASPKEPKLARAPSLLQRLQSINLSRIYRSDTLHADEESEPEAEGGSGSGVKVAEMMMKSASERAHPAKCEWEDGEDEETVEKRRPESARGETMSLGDDEEVDAKADDFINRFKKQLRLQRVDSILRYREMLRGN